MSLAFSPSWRPLHCFLAALALIFIQTASYLKAAEPDDSIRTVIEQQLNAFADDDGPAAYSFAAPMIQMAFPGVDQFMGMVKQGYKPVYRNTARSFGNVFTDDAGRPAMRVRLTDSSGVTWEATYTMQQQPDGTWKIAGCRLEKLPEQAV